VDVRLGARVSQVSADGVRYETAGAVEFVAARSVFWAAGNRAAPLGDYLGAPLDRAGRVEVAPDLSVPGQPNVFIVGDMAAVPYKDGKLVPGVSPAAMQMGRWAAENVLRTLGSQPRRPFRYRNKGDLATIGRHKAVADFGKFTVSGAPAWWLWVVVHIFYLAGFRNRLSVMLQWAWSYLTYQRGVRLIVSARREPPPLG
jgi:NADH:ubiquinone reductase (H+-translocating)